VSLPTIENSSYDIDQTTAQQLPCGAQQFYGKLVSTRESVEVLLYPADILQYVSLDGKSYKAHLAMELQVHRYIMGARFEEEDEFTPEEQERMDIVMNIGKFEKKIGLSMNEKEVYVINKKIDEDNWINLEDFVHSNGGILNIPLFYHTDAPLFIIRHWAKMILQIIAKVHDVSIVLRCLNTKQIWISRDGQRIKLGHTRGVGRVNNLGFIMACPDIYLNLDNNEDR
jgi:serine/threonine protein kinase